jgi:hypothetical protein
MNEKIRQLAEQAGDYVNEVYTPPVRSKEPGKIWEDGHVDWMEQFNEKFAELIVKEAMLVCRTEWVSDSSAQKYGNQCADSIKQHFGVEE